MALNNEDKKDVAKHMGKALANKVSKVTADKKMSKKPVSDSLKKYMLNDRKSAKKPTYIDRLEAHKREASSFDDGTWKPSKKGESFIQALERHKSERDFD